MSRIALSRSSAASRRPLPCCARLARRADRRSRPAAARSSRTSRTSAPRRGSRHEAVWSISTRAPWRLDEPAVYRRGTDERRGGATSAPRRRRRACACASRSPSLPGASRSRCVPEPAGDFALALAQYLPGVALPCRAEGRLALAPSGGLGPRRPGAPRPCTTLLHRATELLYDQHFAAAEAALLRGGRRSRPRSDTVRWMRARVAYLEGEALPRRTTGDGRLAAFARAEALRRRRRRARARARRGLALARHRARPHHHHAGRPACAHSTCCAASAAPPGWRSCFERAIALRPDYVHFGFSAAGDARVGAAQLYRLLPDGAWAAAGARRRARPRPLRRARARGARAPAACASSTRRSSAWRCSAAPPSEARAGAAPRRSACCARALALPVRTPYERTDRRHVQRAARGPAGARLRLQPRRLARPGCWWRSSRRDARALGAPARARGARRRPAHAQAARVWEVNGIRLEAAQVERLATRHRAPDGRRGRAPVDGLALRAGAGRARSSPSTARSRSTPTTAWSRVVNRERPRRRREGGRGEAARDRGQERSSARVAEVLDPAQYENYRAWEERQVEAFRQRGLWSGEPPRAEGPTMKRVAGVLWRACCSRAGRGARRGPRLGGRGAAPTRRGARARRAQRARRRARPRRRLLRREHRRVRRASRSPPRSSAWAPSDGIGLVDDNPVTQHVSKGMLLEEPREDRVPLAPRGRGVAARLARPRGRSAGPPATWPS